MPFQMDHANRMQKNQDNAPLSYKGHIFVQYEGRLTADERRSGRKFYATWGGGYATERAIMFEVDCLIQRGCLTVAA